jgi:hypothetical protein
MWSGEAAPGRSTLTLERQDDGCAAVRSSPLPMGEGARLFEGHPHGTILLCDAVEVMPVLRALGTAFQVGIECRVALGYTVFVLALNKLATRSVPSGDTVILS